MEEIHTRYVEDDDLIKVGVFGFVVARSNVSGKVYTRFIMNEFEGAGLHLQLLNPTDEILGVLPAPMGTFACFVAEEEIRAFRKFTPDEDFLYLE